MDLAEAIRVLSAAGGVVTVPAESGSLSVEAAGARLGFSADWVRDHLAEFPNAWRAPGGRRANGGDLRIPARDLAAFEKRQRIIA